MMPDALLLGQLAQFRQDLFGKEIHADFCDALPDAFRRDQTHESLMKIPLSRGLIERYIGPERLIPDPWDGAGHR